jgi:hypothetical protein
MKIVNKLFNYLGYTPMRVERNRQGVFTYTFLDGNTFVDNGKYLDMYLTNPVLSTIVNFGAQYYSQMRITHLDSQGNEVKNSPYIKLLNTPNYFQSKEDFFYQQKVFLDVSGNDLIYQIKAFTNDIPKALYNLIPSEIDYNNVHKISKFIVTEQDKKAYGEKHIIYKLDNTDYNIKLRDIIPTYDLANGLVQNSFIQSPSRVKAVAKILNNINENVNSKGINLQMSAKYVGLNQNDGNRAQIQDGDRTSIERAISLKNLLLTNAGIDFKHLVSDMKRLYLDEQYTADFAKVLLQFGLNKQILDISDKSNGLNNSGSLINSGLISYIQNTIQQTADNTMNSLAQTWGLFERGESLRASYDHLPVMQSVINDKIKTLTEFQNMVKIGIENGTIDVAEAKNKSKELMLKIGM